MSEAVTPRTRGGFLKPPLRSGRPAQPVSASAPPAIETPGIKSLRRLVWAYFWLLLIEGALRKWFLPQFSAPLLIVRDPVVILIYFLAQQYGITPKHRLFELFLLLAGASVLLMTAQFILLKTPPMVLIYGYRTLFLHIPLIFLLPAIFTREDVLRMGKVLLFVSLPMAALMALQFDSPGTAWINKTAGLGGGLQQTSAYGRFRPSGTFSFVTGPVAFVALVTAFVGYGLVSVRKVFPKWLLILAAIALGLSIAVSGSRSAMISGLIVVAAWFLGTFAGKRLGDRLAPALLVVVVAGIVLGQLELFREGRVVLTERIEMGQQVESAVGGIGGRFVSELIKPLLMLPTIPFFGAGLGVGTNVGATVLTQQMQFLLSEGELGRVLIEMGPLFGLLFVAFRLALVWDFWKGSFRAAKGGDLLPLMLLSACAVNLFNGQIAQPTMLGFTALGAALCATALRHSVAAPVETPRRWSGVRIVKNAS